MTTPEIPKLSASEISIILALSSGQMTGYEIGRQCEEDLADESKMSKGTLYPAIKRLERAGLVEGIESSVALRGRRPIVYRLTQMGRVMLEWQLAAYRRMVRLGEQRI